MTTTTTTLRVMLDTMPPRAAGCAVVLGLDCSSTMIGWCVWDGSVRAYGESALKARDLAERCRQAYALIGLLIETHPDIDCIGIESLVARFAKAVIPQACVHGAVLTRLALFGLHAIEITPGEAKHRLTGSGSASKEAMQEASAPYGVCGEHASDALGVALYGASKVSVTL
jgi:Holliday junction resolvasome RuvABC endonuclease subunit